MGRDQTGFTLLESLTVLLISSIMLILLFDRLPSAYDARIVKHFAEQLEGDLLYAQQAALAQNKKINVLFDADHCEYTIKPADESLTPYLIREYDHKIAIKKSTLRQHFTYSPNGAPSQGGKMLIEANRASFELTIYLGSGKINVQKK
ncbi:MULTISPECIES: competence type IV pilus minor pilin ComGD [Bacillus]|uniref:competence type IV pilus minor pilin ComGD n=1 Tax=Bacillus TaxID=1386 RepID=UPI001582E7B8|nr:competence type IV pilus minor pilin ComGD [Bacillus glycinifermentans]MBU8788315.1 prepilin-type N-terminal cleavage/methylation domain-containing protein [Bacillus glycinifermentans]NUJ18546.1 type II secretion system protein [Bacillus glycinifermentans]